MATFDELLREPNQQSTESPSASPLETLVQTPPAVSSGTPTVSPPAAVSPLEQLAARPNPSDGPLGKLVLQLAPELDSSLDKPSQFDKDNKILNYMNDYREGVINSPVARVVRSAIRTAASSLKAPGEAVESLAIATTGAPYEYGWDKPAIASAAVGLKDLILKGERYLPAPPETDHWWEQTPEAMGSAVAFLGGGLALQAAKVPVLLGTALLGSSAGASSQFEESILMGATPEQAPLAFLGGAAFGLTEAVPGAYFLGKLNKITGGRLAEHIKRFNSNDNPTVIGEAIRGGLTEVLQEGTQTIGGNWVARDFAGYDPTRSLDENLLASMATGGVVGSSFGWGLGKTRSYERSRLLKELEAQRQERLNDPMAWINDIAGPFTPVGDLLALRELEKKAYDHIMERGEQLALDKGVLPGQESADTAKFLETPPVVNPFIDVRRQIPRGFPWDEVAFGPQKAEVIRSYLDMAVDPQVEKGLPKKEDGSGYTILQALAVTPVVTTELDYYKDSIEALTKQIARLETEVQDTTLAPIDLAGKQAFLQTSKDARIALLAKQRIGKKLLLEVKDYVAAFQKVFFNDEMMIVTPVLSAKEKKRIEKKGTEVPLGYMSKIVNANIDPAKPEELVDVGALFIDLEHIIDEIYVNRKLSLEKTKLHQQVFSTLNHELGHAVAMRQLQKLLDDIYDNPDPIEKRKAYRIFSTLVEDYHAALSSVNGDNTAYDYISATGELGISERRKRARTVLDPLKTLPSVSKETRRHVEYLLNFDEFFAEALSRYASQGGIKALGVENKFFDSVLDLYQDMFKLLPSYAQNQYGGNWYRLLEQQSLAYKAQHALDLAQAGGSSDIISALRGSVSGLDPETFAGVQHHLDRWNKGMQWGLNLLQLAKEHSHIPQWQMYLTPVENWAAYQRNFQARANEVLENWRSLGKVEQSQLSDVLYEEALSKKRLPPQILSAKLNGDGLQVYTQIREQLDFVLEEMRATALQETTRTNYSNEEVLAADLKQINEDFDVMKAKGYYPFIRFGKYTITARAKEDLTYNGEKFKKGQLISFPSFETEQARDEAETTIRAELGTKAAISAGVMKETDFVIQGMPRALIKALRNKLEATKELTPEMQEVFDKAMTETIPFKNFRKQFLKKKGILGYSEDARRSFAFYMNSSAGHIARVKYAGDMQDAINSMQESVEIIKEIGGRSQNRQEMVHWLRRHFSYIMNPANELAALRGVGFVMYLGFNIKSTVVNLVQIPQVVYPFLAARHGDVAAVRALTKATYVLQDWFRNRDRYVSGIKLSDKAYWKKKLTYTVRVGSIETAAHFATDAGAIDFWNDLQKTKDVRYYDLSNLNIADPVPEVYKQILEKTLELELAGDRGTLSGGRGALFSVKELSPTEEIVSNIQQLLEEKDYSIIEQKQSESLGLYRGAQALGYDGIYVTESDEYFDSESTVNIFQNVAKIKELTKKQFLNNQKIANENISDSKRRLGLMYAQALHEGWIDQSLATELAIAASENNLDRGLQVAGARRLWHNFSKYSALPFHLVEKINRYITATAAYELEYEKSKNHKKAVLAAKEANYTANYENARWNRPEFMRGKKSVALLFANFLQNSVYFAVKDKGARRYWLMMLLLAGVMGLPGAEDLEELANFAMSMLKKQLGSSNPKVDIQHELRVMLNDLGANPDLILHGISQNSFGMGHVGEMAGIPIPRFDLSASLGMGNIFPLTEIPEMMMTSSPEASFMAAMTSASGASGNLVEDIYRGLFSKDPDMWKRAERMFPMASAVNVSKAVRLAVRGRETSASGATIADFEPFDTRAKLELIGQGLGFMPTRLSLGWERHIAVQDQIRYYKTLQTELLQQHNWAFYTEDREARADVLDRIREYNKQVPMPEMGISTSTIRSSAREYIKKRAYGDLGVVQERKMRRLQKAVEEEYPDPWGDSRDRVSEPEF